MDAPLSQREFDTWRGEHDKKIDVLVGFIKDQTAINLDVEGRVSDVEARQAECAESVSRRTTWISAVVAAVVGGITGWSAR